MTGLLPDRGGRTVTASDRPIPGYLQRVRDVVRGLRSQRLRLSCPGSVSLGDDVAIGKHATIVSPHRFRVGHRVRIGQDFFCEADVEIGDDVLVSSRVSIIGNDHALDDPGTSVYGSPRLPTATVRLEGDNLVGHGTIILGDVRVGRGTVIGAGSLVTHDLPPDSICLGRPAAPVRRRR